MVDLEIKQVLVNPQTKEIVSYHYDEISRFRANRKVYYSVEDEGKEAILDDKGNLITEFFDSIDIHPNGKIYIGKNYTQEEERVALYEFKTNKKKSKYFNHIYLLSKFTIYIGDKSGRMAFYNTNGEQLTPFFNAFNSYFGEKIFVLKTNNKESNKLINIYDVELNQFLFPEFKKVKHYLIDEKSGLIVLKLPDNLVLLYDKDFNKVKTL